MAVNKNPTMSQKFVAEVIGTAFLVWVGPGSITTFSFISAGNMPFTLSDLGWIALAFAFAIVAMIYTIGHISGCHINPAVTLAMAVSKRMSWKDATTYWGAQLVGAFIGAGLIGLAFHNEHDRLPSWNRRARGLESLLGHRDAHFMNRFFLVARAPR